jgi:hypothetical protein
VDASATVDCAEDIPHGGQRAIRRDADRAL